LVGNVRSYSAPHPEEQKGCLLRSSRRHSIQAQKSLALWDDFWKDSTLAELTPQGQEDFVEWLRSKGFKNSYVSRVLGVGRAAIKRAWKRQEITSPPFIIDVRDRSDSNEPYVLTKDEFQRLLTAARRWPHLFVFMMIMTNTLSRPAAVLDLSPGQVDLTDLRIDLNPKGRRQTKKFRPVVPISDTLQPFVQDRCCKRFVLWRNKPVASIKKTFRLAVSAAGLPAEVTPYSLRHTMAVELRRRGVPAWEVEGLLGHRRPGVTETYAKYDPAYLSLGRKAIDAFFAELEIPLPVLADPCVTVACQSPDPGESHVA
jgi:integrase